MTWADPWGPPGEDDPKQDMYFKTRFEKHSLNTYRLRLEYPGGKINDWWGIILISDTPEGVKIRWTKRDIDFPVSMKGLLRRDGSKIVSPLCIVDDQGTAVQLVLIGE